MRVTQFAAFFPEGASLLLVAATIFEVLLGIKAEMEEPEVAAVLVRSRRDSGRAMTFTGFFPNGGMTAYAGGGDISRWLTPRGAYYPGSGDSFPWSSQGEPWLDEEDPWSGKPQGHAPATWTKPKGKPIHAKKEVAAEPGRQEEGNVPVENEQEHADDVKRPIGGGGRASASLNAWFPIVLGMLPESGAQGRGRGYTREGSQLPPAAVVANSVSHGPGGVAFSQAISGGEAQERYRGLRYHRMDR